MKLLALVNNAGYGVYGPTECVSSRKIKNMFEGKHSIIVI